MKVLMVIALTVTLQHVLSEAFGLMDLFARRLIRRAATCLPENARARYIREWEAELAAIPGAGLWRLLFAARVRCRAAATARELGAPSRRTVPRFQLARLTFMALGLFFLIFLSPVTLGLVSLIAVRYGRPVFRSRVVSGRNGREVTLRSFNAPASSGLGRLLDRTDLDALPALVVLARGELWPTFAEFRAIARDVRLGRPTPPLGGRRD